MGWTQWDGKCAAGLAILVRARTGSSWPQAVGWLICTLCLKPAQSISSLRLVILLQVTTILASRYNRSNEHYARYQANAPPALAARCSLLGGYVADLGIHLSGDPLRSSGLCSVFLDGHSFCLRRRAVDGLANGPRRC